MPRAHRAYRGAALLSLFFVVVLGSVGFHSQTRADEASGTWTGKIETRGNYYWERSTRVVAPEVSASLESPKGARVRVGYLVDVITSASIATGALDDVLFTEVRHDVRGGAGVNLEVRDQTVELDADVRFSKEPDYFSSRFDLTAAMPLNQNSTTVRAHVGVVHDEVRQTFRLGTGSLPSTGGSTSADRFAESFNGIATGISLEQTLTPTLVAQLNYDFGLLRGFLANPYRSVAGGQIRETHPNSRRRHTLSARLGWYIPRTRTSLQAIYRAYVDSWSIAAINPEFRIYQEFTRFLQVRMRYRFYKQNASFFFKSDPNDYTVQDSFATADPKMSSFRTHEAGLQLRVGGDFFENTAFHWLSRATLDLNFDYIWSNSNYGNGVVAIAGATFPF